MDNNTVSDLFNKKVFEIAGLYLKDLKKSYYGREIARTLKMNLKVVQDTLKSLEKAKVLESERKGKTKVYYLNTTNILTRYMLIGAELYKTAKFLELAYEIKKLFKIVSEEVKGVALIYRSYAKDTYTDESDIDIAIIGKYAKDKLEKELEMLPKKIHITILKESQILKGISTKDPFVMEILQNHYVIKGVDKVVEWLIEYGKD